MNKPLFRGALQHHMQAVHSTVIKKMTNFLVKHEKNEENVQKNAKPLTNLKKCNWWCFCPKQEITPPFY